MAAGSTPGLRNFFVYNSTLGPREGEEHKKVLYYQPQDATIDTKVRHVGLAEAMVQFTRTFSPEQPCEVVHTQKARQIFFNPEPDYWIVMTISLPSVEVTHKDGKKGLEYREEDVQDSVYKSVLEVAYRMFKLFHGPFGNIRQKHDVEGLRHTLNHFFSKYLPTLRLGQLDLLDVFNGIQFLPLDKNAFLRIQSFVNLLESSFTSIKYTAFLFDDQLVWSGLEQEDMRVLYKYLTTSLFPSFKPEGAVLAIPASNNPDWLLVSSPGLPSPTPGSSLRPNSGPGMRTQPPHQGWFLTGPKNIQDPGTPIKMPRIFVNTTTQMEELNLLVYHALGASVCFMTESAGSTSYDFCKRLDGFVGPHLSSLAKMIGDYLLQRRPSAGDAQYRYIYFNHMNLAQKSSVHNKKPPQVAISPDLMRVLSDINADFQRSQEDGETVIKTMTDCWVVGRRSDQREFFVVLNQKNANLIEISEEVKRLSSTHFNNIFFLD